MVKIIKYGQNKRVTCPRCGAVLEYTRTDITIKWVGHDNFKKYIMCPVCLKSIEVLEEKINVKKL